MSLMIPGAGKDNQYIVLAASRNLVVTQRLSVFKVIYVVEVAGFGR
jgi:hypothetical protein